MNQQWQGALCLARSLKVVNEALTSLDLGFNEIRVRICCFVFLIFGSYGNYIISNVNVIFVWIQDDGAFAIAQALKSNDDVAVTSLNIANNFLTKFGQVTYLLVLLF